MADEWLSVAQVAAIAARNGAIGGMSSPVAIQRAARVLTEQDMPALLAQDGRWRALMGELLDYVEHWPECPLAVSLNTAPCGCGLAALECQAQAALDEAVHEG